MTHAERDARLTSPSTQRNHEPIWSVLQPHMPERGIVLELASGSGEHGAIFAPKVPHLQWISSDLDPRAISSIQAWRIERQADNWLPPLQIDVTTDDWGISEAALITCINMIHISPWSATEGLFRGASRLLNTGGILFLYGPYKIDGQHTAPSNEAFDISLQSRDPQWGVRALEDLLELATAHGLSLLERVAMPANNFSLVFRREDTPCTSK